MGAGHPHPPGRFFAGAPSSASPARSAGRSRPGSCVATEGQPADPRLEGTPFAAYPQRENFILAAAWWRSEGLDEAASLRGGEELPGRPPPPRRVATIDGVTYWNDSKATNFHAVEAALAGFREPVVLIAGGRSKGGDLAGSPAGSPRASPTPF
jgi:UDP-N-acetylmuramoylalanine--D-glutamate ligase